MSVTKNYRKMLEAADIQGLQQWYQQTFINKYYDLYRSQFEVSGLSYQAEDYLFAQLWKQGSVWVRKNIVNEPVVCQYAGYSYNHYNYPTQVTLINTHNAPLTEIPNTPQTVDVDGCIVYLRKNKKGLEDDVMYYIAKMSEAEACISINLAIQRTPWIFAGNGLSNEKIKKMCTQILGNDIVIFANMDKSDFETVELDREYIIDKLTEYEERLENKLKTLIGVDNQGGYLNREQQNLDTTNSNNDEINDMSNSMFDTLKKSFERARELGIEINIKQTSKPVEQISVSKSAKLDEESN